VTTRCLRLTESITVPKHGAFTLTLRRTAEKGVRGAVGARLWPVARGCQQKPYRGAAMTPETNENLQALVDRASAAFEALTPEMQRAHREAQRASWVRAMTTRCEHGVLDFEQCPECRAVASIPTNKDI
jgi:hypothetical protein